MGDTQHGPWTLVDLQREAYRIAVARGQWDAARRSGADYVPATALAWGAIHQEAQELEEALSQLNHGALGAVGRLCDELADVVIVCASIAEALGIDLDAAVRRKMTANEGRVPAREGDSENARVDAGATGGVAAGCGGGDAGAVED